MNEEYDESATATPRIVKAAPFVAFAMAALMAVGALSGGIVALALALVPLFAGIGILRRRVWSAYGLAVFLAAPAALVPLTLLRAGGATSGVYRILASGAFSLLMGAYFLSAGRALTRMGAPRGRAFPWIAIALASTLPLIFFEPFVMPTGSMENAIVPGDRILVRRLPRPAPARDEIVAMIYPIDRKQVFVKRIAGMPGDRIRMANKALIRNGVRLSEPWAVHKTDYMDSYRDNFPAEPDSPLFPPAREMLAKNVVNGEVIVPPGRYFVLGDNRDQSLDSRYWGFISETDILGTPAMIYDSIEQSSDFLVKPNPLQLGHRRWERLFKPL